MEHYQAQINLLSQLTSLNNPLAGTQLYINPITKLPAPFRLHRFLPTPRFGGAA
jgi:hypothetical protein